MANVFALLRLLPVSNRDKDTEILALRHQLSVLQRQLGPGRLRFTPADRALLAALLHRLPRHVLKRLHLVVRPDTVLRWHRDMVARRHARRSRPRHPGRPPTVRSIRVLVLRLVRENPGWGYRRVHGELLVLGVKVAASTVWEILHDAGIDPAPERSSTTWADFLRSQAGALLAWDFFERVTLSGTRLHVLAVIEQLVVAEPPKHQAKQHPGRSPRSGAAPMVMARVALNDAFASRSSPGIAPRASSLVATGAGASAPAGRRRALVPALGRAVP